MLKQYKNAYVHRNCTSSRAQVTQSKDSKFSKIPYTQRKYDLPVAYQNYATSQEIVLSSNCISDDFLRQVHRFVRSNNCP